MIIKHLTQLAELIEDTLSNVANLSKSFRTFIIETMELYLTSSGRMNFTQMARCRRSCESRFSQNFKKSFDWMTFNKHFVNTMSKERTAIAIDPCFVPKSGKKTPGLDWFWSGAISLGFKSISRFRDDVNLKYIYRGPKTGKQFMGLTHCQTRNKEAMSFAFNASLSSVNVARAYARKERYNLSVGATKTLVHNAAMLDRFNSISAKNANRRLNNTDFKELLFYGVRNAG
jgi:hypothetical protein